MSEEEFLNVLGPFFEEEVVEEEGGEVLKSQKSRGSPHLVKPYVPKAEHDGWFHPLPVDTGLADLMESKHGPHQVKVAVEHHYMHRRYEEVLLIVQSVLDYLKRTRSPKCTDQAFATRCREWREIGAYAASKAGRHAEAKDLLGPFSTSNEPGHHWTRGKILCAGKEIEEGAMALRKYLSLRPGDANAWRVLGDALLTLSPTPSSLSRQCYRHALTLYNLSSWPGDSGDRRERVRCELEGKVKEIEERMSNPLEAHSSEDQEMWVSELDGWIQGALKEYEMRIIQPS